MKRNLHQPLWWTLAGTIGLALGLALAFYILRPQSPIPENIQQQLNFVVLYPNAQQGYAFPKEKISYDPQPKLLIFHAVKDDMDLTISEQAAPDQFTDIPEYFSKLTERLHSYNSFDSVYGRVALTRPDELKGGQSAVFNGRGTLMFIHPSRDLSTDEWRHIFNNVLTIGL